MQIYAYADPVPWPDPGSPEHWEKSGRFFSADTFVEFLPLYCLLYSDSSGGSIDKSPLIL